MKKFFFYILCSFFFASYPLSACRPTIEELFEDISKEISNPYLKIYKDEINRLRSPQANLPLHCSVDYILVLSGRAAYNKTPVDHPDVKDLADDYYRMELGIKIAKESIALKLQKDVENISSRELEKYGPFIIYNGRPAHNNTLKEVLEKNELNTFYPKNKFIILELDSQNLSTRGQFDCLSQNFDSQLKDRPIVIVTHAYHFPRVSRMIDMSFSPFKHNKNVYFYLVDRELEAPGVKDDLKGEIIRIDSYIQQQFITQDIPLWIEQGKNY